MSHVAGSETPTIVAMSELVQELLDAHCDTICLAQDTCDGSDWGAHLDYLRALRRAGQNALSRLPG